MTKQERMEQAKQAAIDKFLDAGLAVAETSARCLHLKIVGGVRHVEYYPTTGTVYANAVAGKFEQYKGRTVETAIKVARGLTQ